MKAVQVCKLCSFLTIAAEVKTKASLQNVHVALKFYIINFILSDIGLKIKNEVQLKENLNTKMKD